MDFKRKINELELRIFSLEKNNDLMKKKINQLKDFYAAPFLLIDLLQLSALLYLTGGIFNPFSFLLVIPAIVSSTFLSMGTTIILGLITSSLLLTISIMIFSCLCNGYFVSIAFAVKPSTPTSENLGFSSIDFIFPVL